MDSFEMNKMIGALLAVVFIVFSISIVSEAIFASPTPETAGYAIEAAEPDAGAASEAGPAEAPIAVRLQTASAEAGAQLFKRCAACHTDDSGGANKIGPNLWNIVNRPVAAHEGFSYSGAMKEHAATNPTWDYDHLDQFIAAPKAVVRGTAMSYAGLKSPEDRASLIAYLRSTADSPAPLPEAPAAGAETATPVDSGSNAQGENPAAGTGSGAAGQMANPPGVEGSAESESTGAPLPQAPAVETPDGEAPTANPAAPDQPESGAGAPNNTQAPAQSDPQGGAAGSAPAEPSTGAGRGQPDQTEAPAETDGGAPADGAAPFQGGGQGN